MNVKLFYISHGDDDEAMLNNIEVSQNKFCGIKIVSGRISVFRKSSRFYNLLNVKKKAFNVVNHHFFKASELLRSHLYHRQTQMPSGINFKRQNFPFCSSCCCRPFIYFCHSHDERTWKGTWSNLLLSHCYVCPCCCCNCDLVHFASNFAP